MKFAMIVAMLASLLTLQGCKTGPIEGFDVKVGTNKVTTTLNLAEKFALQLDGNFQIDIKGNNYGEIFVASKTDENPFRLGLTISLDAFTGDVWEGFDTVTSLPNGDPLPVWIDPYELVRVDIPTLSNEWGLLLYGGYSNPYYVGLGLTLKILNDYYPEGLQVSQSFKKDGNNWGTVQLFGPSRDGDGNIVQHGGVFFVVSISAFLPDGTLDMSALEAGEVVFSGRDAHLYESKKAKKKFFKKLEKAVQEFNKQQKLLK